MDPAVSRMMGRRDLYAKLACRMALERADLPRDLERALQADDRESLTNLIHGAKSLLGALGAGALQHACVELQKRAFAKARSPATTSGGLLLTKCTCCWLCSNWLQPQPNHTNHDSAQPF